MEMKEFNLTNIEYVKLKKFQEKHYKKCLSGTSVIFTGTGISVKVEVKCHKCEKIKDISDYNVW